MKFICWNIAGGHLFSESLEDAFSRNYSLASEQFSKAIKEIDKTIDHLNKAKERLSISDNNLRLASYNESELTVKRLTAKSLSVVKTFEEKAITW